MMSEKVILALGEVCKTRFPITECPNMKQVTGDLDMNYEHYECSVCGKRDYLDYEEMK